MVCLWLDDHPIFTPGTGVAALSNYYWQLRLKDAGITVVDKDYKGDIDIVVVGNTYSIGGQLKELIGGRKYITINHSTMVPEPYAGFFDGAAMNITMSPEHAKWFRNRTSAKKVTYSPPYVPTVFDHIKNPNANGYVYIGALLEHKGLRRIAQYGLDHQISIDAYGAGDFRPFGLNYKKEVSYADLPAIFANYSHFVWFLDRFGSYGRTIVEALLAGMEFVGNRENFGVFSYTWDWSNPQDIRSKLDNYYLTFPQFFQ